VRASFAISHGPTSELHGNSSKRNRSALVLGVALALIAGAVVRSAVATRLGDLNLDEPYHIAAGISYVRLHDYRINPEHPPLVKRWVGLAFAPTDFRLSPFRRFGIRTMSGNSQMCGFLQTMVRTGSSVELAPRCSF